MSLTRLLLRPAARLAGMHAARQLRRFLRAASAGRRTQDELLRRLVEWGRPTRFGRDHHLASVNTYDDFRRAVPVGGYESLAPYLRDVFEGDTEALLPPGADVLLFALTSGTTGEPKRIPITRRSLAFYRAGWNAFGCKLLNDHPDAWLRKILQISSPMAESFSPTGVPCGSISGLLAATQQRIVRRMYAAPADLMGIRDPAAKYYSLLRAAMPKDVGLISTANPSSVIKLLLCAREHAESLLRDLRDGTITPPGEPPPDLRRTLRLRKHPRLVRRIEAGLARDGELKAAHFWDLSVLLHWTGGTLGLYLPQLRELTDNAPIRDIGLLASEGRFTIPMADETPSGLADMLGAFLEFIPAEQADAAEPTVLRSDELDVGGEYFLVLTNFSGLWRYNINDRIRVTDHYADTPVFEFLSKGAHTANMTGEKLTEHQLVAAMDQAGRRIGFSVQRFVAQPCFASPPYYRVTVETEGAAPARLAEILDAALVQLNIEYASKRHSGRLGPVQVVSDRPEVFARRERELLAVREGRQEQYKHQYLLTEVLTEATANT